MEESQGMCYGVLKALQQDEPIDDGGGGKKKPPGAGALKKDPAFVAVLAELERQRVNGGSGLRISSGFELHPKMVALRDLIIQHFGARLADTGGEGEGEGAARDAMAEGRVMVFAAYREVVDEIVELLNKEKPLIRAMKLVGQAADKQGNAGLNQRKQQEASSCPSSICGTLTADRCSTGSRRAKAMCLWRRPSARRVLISARLTWWYATMHRRPPSAW
jgi:ATP-dependent DNA helicase MPH1